ncbi:MAG: muropeptide transporter [Planctomycetes bacterium ADurb.Bin126]|nr:MAG: muropeptide transporter [Planctomycetes bacterium ADurb.Bin126]HOD81393.1 MFS transporter [Phycisphaerae bacterium]HQL76278.1 MFS transporter [Phycisphaerae bacterium]
MIGYNPLASSWGRKITFFMLYFTEGLPQGFTLVAIVGLMSRRGFDERTVGSFAAAMTLPWAFKWVVGPFVDLIFSRRLGRRRGWILGTQLLMAVGIVAALRLDFASQLDLFKMVMVFVNGFAAAQDVAIDALACDTLDEKERGQINGMMFAGAYLGTAAGGSGVLYISRLAADLSAPGVANVDAAIGLPAAMIALVAVLLAITLFFVVPMREKPTEDLPLHSSFRQAGRRLTTYVGEAGRSFFASRTALAALAFAILPTGAYALGMAVTTKLATNLGFDENRLANLNLVTASIGAASCVVGGLLADKFGKRRMIAIYAALTIVPNLVLAGWMLSSGVDFTLNPKAAGYAAPAMTFLTMFWCVNIGFSVFQGLLWGSRAGLYMDVVNPRVAATQFTAYMAVQNVVLTYSQWWTGLAVGEWKLGYGTMYLADVALGLLCLPLLLWMKPRVKGPDEPVLPEIEAIEPLVERA